MFSRFKTVAFIAAIFSFLTVHGAALIDTAAKKTPGRSVAPAYRISDMLTNYREGLEDIHGDSLVKGIHLLADGLQQAVATKSIDRVLDYSGREIVDLLIMIDRGNLSPAERKLGRAFVKLAFNSTGTPDEKQLANAFKIAPNTLFTKRLQLLSLSLNGGDPMILAMDKLLKEQPSFLSVNILKAQVYYDEDKYAESIKWCNKVILLSAQNVFAYQLRGKCYNELDKPDSALTDFNKVLQAFPYHAEVNYDRAEILLDQSKYREALAGFFITQQQGSGYGDPYYKISQCYSGLDMPDSGLYYINLHITKNPDDGYGYHMKGNYYFDKQDYGTSIAFYNSALKLEPKNAQFYTDRGDAYFYADSVDAALADYQQVIKLDPKHGYAYAMMGDCYYNMKSYMEAATWQEKAIKVEPSRKEDYVDLDITYSKLGRYREGIIALKQAIAIDTAYSTAYGNIGWDYYKLNEFDDCITWSYSALKFDEKATNAMFNIALATLRQGDFDNAKQLYSKYIALCKEKGYDIGNGPLDDLNELINKDVHAAQAAYILEKIFQLTPVK